MFRFLFGRNEIRKRVMAVINQKIAEAEEALSDGIRAIDEKAAEDKDALADKMVNDIVSKII